jgi:glyoxylase-like metal-dependent hydrolase (beta-lactamase superfamily II)
MNDRHSFKIGNFNCLAINDGGMIGQASHLFTNAPELVLHRALEGHGLQPDHLPSTWTCLLVETPNHFVLVDTGENNVGNLGGGQLLPALRAEGIAPGDIDIVILTHGHGDHIGGCVDAGGQPNFPNARYVMAQSEWDYWTDMEGKSEWIAKLIQHCLLPLKPQLETIQPEIEIVPGIRALSAPGHTVGHLALVIESEDEHLLHIADAILHPIQVEYPNWIAAYDMFSEQTVKTRRALCQRAIEIGALVLAYHFSPFPSVGRIIEIEGTWRWEILKMI